MYVGKQRGWHDSQVLSVVNNYAQALFYSLLHSTSLSQTLTWTLRVVQGTWVKTKAVAALRRQQPCQNKDDSNQTVESCAVTVVIAGAGLFFILKHAMLLLSWFPMLKIKPCR